MPSGLFRRAPQEHPAGPLEGHKLAFPMLSADGTTAGFSGVTLGRAHVYRTVDDALCAHGCRHACPSRWCDYGFYCFHSDADARELACAPEHQGAVLLEVAVSGRFRRYELGLRYSRQRVRSVRMRPCRCGAGVSALADTGSGQHGWRRLEPVCGRCAGARPVLTPERFTRLAGVLLLPDDVPAGPLVPAGDAVPTGPHPLDDSAFGAPPLADSGDPVATAGAVAVLTAEMALLQARLDEMARQLGRATARLDELEGRDL
ncbi:hypothetical protein Ae168Ps1_5788 [Pseudonocardia sp. Ae168_Ps1]|uniref:hypothetical protein n=1 Tax=unclassified Pseudonocardia TaxID=2619320 RepID=UPI00094ADE7F|nr:MULTISPECIES: hypothetical protein [unclassified Pseudonocardia]OLL71285.1 hypothetical protein Ae168Ps1_5788 [Pseudonocardia sp. Ae168_Ps1]OLL77164.1 hypothetical protein Ae150APs1_5542c [Pseudonocardia sp. Ae150A_Ps1]OLL88728.1 hypothetical protein Ae263Ps1_5783 [Pseudonocardia sp. Ae263_Ps1]OLL91252.1 hypothetical protein Ae356Ps1_1149c [Pseudonocardia sp. Ae356_Ps1]